MSASGSAPTAGSEPSRPAPLGGRGPTTLLLAAGVAWSLTRVDWSRPVLHANGLDALGRILGAALRPDLSPDVLRIAVEAAWRTVASATAGVSLAVLLALPACVVASGALSRSAPSRVVAVGYTLYRWECGLRSAAILSFVGLGGLGYQIQLALSDLRFEEVWTFVYALVAIVVATDWWAGTIRRRLIA